MVRTNAITRLAATIDPPCSTGRPRLWSTLVMLQALWWLCRAGAAWKLLPTIYPPRQTIGSRLERWVTLEVLERALAVLNGCLRPSGAAQAAPAPAETDHRLRR
jgi:transposase